MTQTVLLGDIVRVRRGSSPRPIQNYIQSKPGVPWLKIADATAANSRFITKTKEYIKEEGRKNSVSVTPGTLIMSNSATPGLPMIMKIDASVHDGWLILDELKGVERDWLYYYLLNRRAQSAREASGSVFSNLKTDIVRSFKVRLPDINTQRKVANILWTIDEKIELNRKINDTLERMGQALFNHYFINNFKAEKHNGKFSDIVDVLTGKGSTKSLLAEGGRYPLYGAGGIMGTSDSFLLDENLIITGRVGTLGKVQAVTGPAWFSDNVIIMKPKDNFFGYAYFLAKSIDFTSMNRGSSQPLITQTDIKNINITIPEQTALIEFEQQFNNVFNKIQDNNKQIHTLTTLRDTLLPRLISGKIELNEAD